eukprot:jgi/Undpi1/3836/HiC_scaffold_16.g07205.m1
MLAFPPCIRGVVHNAVPSAVPWNSPRKSTLGSSGRSHSLNRDNHPHLLVDVKTYKDTLYGSLALEPVILRLMDTPQFQRLHGLKQLGTSDYVYRSCTHTRFEHSVGVAHLAQRFAEGLRRRQPELGISVVDVMCVKIAGLLHDLGHGPFSHMWDGGFLRRSGVVWTHERGSVNMLRFMLKDNMIDLSAYEPPLFAKDLTFIEEMILGTRQEERRGRGADKEFLYDIVNNTRSGLDVDKLDYFQRDARNSVGVRTVDLDRFIELARVLPATDENGEVHRMVCYPDKLWTEALGLFRTRKELHQFVYQHKGGVSVELMLIDALLLADPFISVAGTVDGKHPDGRWRMSEAVLDCKAYTHLKDSAVDLVMNDPNPMLAPAKAIIDRLQRRQLYPCVGTTEFDFTAAGISTEDEAKRTMIDMLKRPVTPEVDVLEKVSGRPPRCAESGAGESDTDIEDEKDGGCGAGDGISNGGGGGRGPSTSAVLLEEKDIIVQFVHIHWGLKGENPVNRLRFFSKYAPTAPDTRGVRLDEKKFSSFLPHTFETKMLRVFVRDPAKVDAARRALDLFCSESRCAPPGKIAGVAPENEAPILDGGVPAPGGDVPARSDALSVPVDGIPPLCDGEVVTFQILMVPMVACQPLVMT